MEVPKESVKVSVLEPCADNSLAFSVNTGMNASGNRVQCPL